MVTACVVSEHSWASLTVTHREVSYTFTVTVT